MSWYLLPHDWSKYATCNIGVLCKNLIFLHSCLPASSGTNQVHQISCKDLNLSWPKWTAPFFISTQISSPRFKLFLLLMSMRGGRDKILSTLKDEPVLWFRQIVFTLFPRTLRDYLLYFLIDFYWSIVDLKCCDSFCCVVKWISCAYTYIHPF